MPVQTLPFSNLIPIDRALSWPVYQQVADGIIQLVKADRLKKDFPLPSSREMADLLKLNRTTIVAAYEELKSLGWIEVVPRKGVFVSGTIPEANPTSFLSTQGPAGDPSPAVRFYRKVGEDKAAGRNGRLYYDLLISDGYPDARIAPLQAIMSRYKNLIGKQYKHTALINETSAGSLLLRTELSQFLSQTRALDVSPEHILTTRGAQGAIYIAAQMILKPGSRVIVGNLSYSMANKVFRDLGATLIKVPVDENGMDVDMIDAICKTDTPDLLYIIPHHHHPTTVTLSAERRTRLMSIIRTYRLPVIEDDYDYDFHYDKSPILPLASADHQGLILYIGSISKTLAMTIRSGYLVAQPDFIWQAGKLKELMELRSDFLMEDALAYTFKTGEIQRHIARSLKLYAGRRDFLCELLAGKLNGAVQFRKPLGGMAVWAMFAASYPLPQISEKLGKKGIYMTDGSIYSQGDPTVNGLRIGFASLNEAEIERFVNEVYNALG